MDLTEDDLHAVNALPIRRPHDEQKLACCHRSAVRNSFGFRPLAEDRGFPGDASAGLQGEFAGFGPRDVHGTTWLTWVEQNTTDWRETDASGTRTRASVAGIDTDWGRVWSVMRILACCGGRRGSSARERA